MQKQRERSWDVSGHTSTVVIYSQQDSTCLFGSILQNFQGQTLGGLQLLEFCCCLREEEASVCVGWARDLGLKCP